MPAEDFWQPVYNAFNPWERLWGEKPNTFFVEREHSPLKKLTRQFQPGRAVQKTLLNPDTPYQEGLDTMIEVVHRRLCTLGYKPGYLPLFPPHLPGIPGGAGGRRPGGLH